MVFYSTMNGLIGRRFCNSKGNMGFVKYYPGLEKCLYMGNLDTLRDWAYTKGYVRMQWMMLQ